MKLHFGTIIDINDPLKMGRVKVKVFGIHSMDEARIPTDKMFWSTVMMPSTSASTGGVGQTHSLLLNTHVICTFLDVYMQQCIVLGTFYGVDDLPTPALNNYPQNRVTVTESGHSLQFNDATAEVILSNKNGNNILLDDSVNLKSIADINLDSDANTSIKIGSDLNVGVSGNSSISTSGAMTLKSGGNLILAAPRIDINPSFSFAEPSLTDLQTVTIKKRKKANYPIISNISQKDDVLVEKVEPGNVCSLKNPLNLYDTAFETIDADWNEKTINVLFEEIGFNNNTYDGEVYWGTVWLGAVLKRAGYKYLKTAVAGDYLIYENSSEVKKELTESDLTKGDIIIFTRGDSHFSAVYEGTHNSEYNYYTVIMGDTNDGVYVTDVFIDDETQIKRIIRARGCADNKIFYNGNCTIPNIKTGYMINDDHLALALNIYHEARGETKLLIDNKYPQGQIAVAYTVLNRLYLINTYGLVNGYRSFIQKYKQPSQTNPYTISGICFANAQYSWTLPYRIDSNGKSVGGIKDWTPTIKDAWCLALDIAEKVINGELKDPTNINNLECGSVFYFAQNTVTPYWYSTLLKYGYTPLLIGNHTFMIQPSNKPIA